MMDAREFFDGFTADGVSIIAALKLLKPGETVVYHVGHLPSDCNDQSESYRLGDVQPAEVARISSTAELLAEQGCCQLLQTPVTRNISVYYAIGVEPRS
jgi:ketopantoate hydroxymethyltransferase